MRVQTAIDWTPKARAVLDAASELFYAHGIHAVGVEAIAERAGVTKKTLYDRFGSKERLVVEYLGARDRRWRALLAERQGVAGHGPAEQVDAIFAASQEWSASDGPNGCAMINAHAEINDPSHPAYAVIVEQKQWMLQQFRTVVGEEDLARELFLLHEGALVTHGVGVLDDVFDRARAGAAALLR